MDPIEVLKLLIPQPKTTFVLPSITIKEVENIIKRMKKSNTSGFDGISTRFLKLIPEISAAFLANAINTSIASSTFPEILKISRILPLSKPEKDLNEMSSYRPISNLHTFDKIIEEHIKHHLMMYLERNKIILNNHHGGLKGLSTLTAKNTVDYTIGKGIDNGKTTVILSTDLSAAYDTVDHEILVRKLFYYGIRGSELDFVISYLSNRSHYIELDGQRSNVVMSGSSSVI